MRLSIVTIDVTDSTNVLHRKPVILYITDVINRIGLSSSVLSRSIYIYPLVSAFVPPRRRWRLEIESLAVIWWILWFLMAPFLVNVSDSSFFASLVTWFLLVLGVSDRFFMSVDRFWVSFGGLGFRYEWSKAGWCVSAWCYSTMHFLPKVIPARPILGKMGSWDTLILQPVSRQSFSLQPY